MKIATIRRTNHTIMRGTRLDFLGGRLRVGRNMEPPAGVDPYASDFDTHDPANYTRVYSVWIWIAMRRGHVTITYEPGAPNPLSMTSNA